MYRLQWRDYTRNASWLQGIETVIAGLPYEASLVAVERYACETMRKVVKQYNSKFPEVIAIVHEMDPRYLCLFLCASFCHYIAVQCGRHTDDHTMIQRVCFFNSLDSSQGRHSCNRQQRPKPRSRRVSRRGPSGQLWQGKSARGPCPGWSPSPRQRAGQNHGALEEQQLQTGASGENGKHGNTPCVES